MKNKFYYLFVPFFVVFLSWITIYSCQKEQTIDYTAGVVLFTCSEESPEGVKIAVIRSVEKGILLRNNLFGKPLNEQEDILYLIKDQEDKSYNFTSKDVFDQTISLDLRTKIKIYRNGQLIFTED